ncbi:transmembrane and coiled-coil domains protein 1-like isoform X4 [Mercenaria mercenaria]|uniref:transmembrane and coiled-coil domains protein 1-like isoform X4 n=1 Tax=Mercenaria mercenaria TaxID=6596 RepID=UPI00234E8596|nr:transmembrane and coiled-coil domains protein 1-like isoform X4 [Mercenaria mercenaria]
MSKFKEVDTLRTIPVKTKESYGKSARYSPSLKWRSVGCKEGVLKHRTAHLKRLPSHNGLVAKRNVGKGLSRSCHDVSVAHSDHHNNQVLLGSPQAAQKLGQQKNIIKPRREIEPNILMNWETLKQRRSSFPARKKSETRLPVLKPGLKKTSSKSPSVQKRQVSPENSLGKPRNTTLQLPDEAGFSQPLSRSLEDLEKDDDSGTKENGSGCSDITDETDGGAAEGESARTRAAIEHIQEKITRTMDQIKEEQATKEANVNEYLRLAGEADKQQLLRIKQVFEKKNQKSTQSLSTLQKKLEKYTKSLNDVQTYGAHRQTKDKLKDMGQGLKDVGANIVDGITGFSGGVVGNIKGAKETIVSKPKEFAHLIKNKFGSADNISSMKVSEDGQMEEGEKSQGGGTLPARDGLPHRRCYKQSFKFDSDEDKSSITSGSGFGAHSSPQSNSQNASQQIVIPQAALDTLIQELRESKESSNMLQEKLQRVIDDFDAYKVGTQQELSHIKGVLEEDRFRIGGMEEQMNDISELNQHQVSNLRQDMGNIVSMEEKIEYRLDERTADIQDLLENCQTRITKMELQQQQQQIISMEMVENVTFRTILTKLINVVLALLAVILVFVSTFANLLAPFLANRARILSTAVLVLSLILSWNNWSHICDFFNYVFSYIRYLLPNR